MGTQIKILAPYLINGFTTVGLSVDPDPPAVGYYNLFLRDNEEYCLQNSDNDIVVINGGGGSVPVATSASGGGIQGKLTTDSNYGLVITAGVLTFSLSSTGGLEFQTGSLKAKFDGSTLTSSASGIKVADNSLTDTQVNTSAGITRSKLASGTNNGIVRNNSSGVMTDSANLTFSEGASNHLFSVKANAAQSTNLFEWQNSAGTAMSYVDSAGNILVPAAPTTGNMLVNKTYADALSTSGLELVGQDYVVSGTDTVLQVTGLSLDDFSYYVEWRVNTTGATFTPFVVINNDATQTGYARTNTAGTTTSNSSSIAGSLTTGSSAAGIMFVNIGKVAGGNFVWQLYQIVSGAINIKCITKATGATTDGTSIEIKGGTFDVNSYIRVWKLNKVALTP